MFMEPGLQEESRLRGIDPSRQHIQDHLADIFPNTLRIRVFSRERMPIGYEKEALIRFLQSAPVVQGPEQVAEMQPSRRPHPAQDSTLRHRLSCSSCSYAPSNRPATSAMGGQISRSTTPLNIRTSRITKPYRSSLPYEAACRGGKRPAKTRPPSSGNRGIRLKMARATLISTLQCNMRWTGVSHASHQADSLTPSVPSNCRSNQAHTEARTRFAPGPAAATKTISRLG